MKVRHLLLGSILALLLVCRADAQAPVLSNIEAPHPALQNSVTLAGVAYGSGSVTYGPAGTPLILSGSNFGSTGTVEFPGTTTGSTVAGTVTSWSPVIIFVTVPSGATSGLVEVVPSGGVASNGRPFIVTSGTYAGVCPVSPNKNQLEIVTASLPNGEVGTSYSATLSASGGTPPYTWSLIGNTLPAGLSLSASTGTISGTPTAPAGPVGLTVKAADSSSQVTDAVLGITVDTQTLSPATVYSYSGSYDGVGNVASYSDSVMGTWNFTYDSLNRLMSGAPVTDPQQYLCMDYDSFGNRTQSDFQTTPCVPNPVPEVSSSLYDPSTAKYNVYNQVTWTTVNAAVNGFTYDAAGNVLYDGNNYYAYDGEGRLCAVQTSPLSGGTVAFGYIYDAEGRRVAKGSINVTSTPLASSVCNSTTNGFTLTEDYVLGQSGEQLTMLGPGGAWQRTNVYGAGKLLATYDTAGLHFQLTDPLGTRRVQTNTAGEPELDCQSLPFGGQQNCYPDSAAPGDDSTPLHFTGKERDTESGNDYFGARYYGSSMGRFLSPDWSGDPEPIPFADITNPQSLNLYSYGSNNPLSTVDPDGHDVSICPAGATQITSACQTISDDQYKASLNGNGSLSLPSFSSLQQNGSGDITGSDVGSAGTAIYTPNNPGVDGAANATAFGQIGDQGMGAINFFMTNMALSAVGETALNGVRLGAEAVMAARAAKAADAAAQATSQSWKFGAFKSAAKWANQLLQRGWTESEITDTIANGERYPAPNNINPANGATRFVSPTTGKSVVVDNVTNEVLHVGGSGFQY